MAESKHTPGSAAFTPGPWRVGACGPNGCYTVGTENGLMTAMVAHSVNHPEQREQAIADARLIASSPLLLEALQACQSALSMLTEPREVRTTTVTQAWGTAVAAEQKARAAIAAATGAA